MSISMDPSRQINSEEILSIENINTTLSSLLDCLSKVNDSIPQSSSNNNLDAEYHFTHEQLDKLQKHLNKIKEAFQTHNNFEYDAGGRIKKLKNSLDDIYKVVTESPKDIPIKEIQAKLSALKKDATELKSSIPPWRPKMSSKSSDILVHSWTKNGFNSEVDELPSLYMSPKFLYSSVFTEFQEVFDGLNNRLRLCLLSFAILPANTVVKRRLLIDWWVGEDLVDPPSPKEILTELVVKGFIEEVKEGHKPVADRLKMQPQVRHVVLMLAQDAGFSVQNLNGIKTIISSRCNWAFLVKADNRNSELTKERPDFQENCKTIFNINEPFPDQSFELFAKGKNVNTVEWFSKMKNVNVLYLGRWQSSGQHHIEGQSSGQHHIEVESTEFLKGLKNMECLRLLSLQGISRINELPNSIDKLTNLRILDLKACHNLEVLPDEIVSLKKLLRLDISECYLLDDMPKGLASLLELQVLKGFIIGNSKSRNSCTLEDLVGLKQLSKLSINTSSEAFPTGKELHALRELEALRKLAITWGGKTTEKENAELTSEATVNLDNIGDDKSRHGREEKSTSGSNRPNRKQTINPDAVGLPLELEKLELQCFPHSDIPSWLIPEKLKSLKKLHIIGGKKLERLGPDKWTVEILRLKHLHKFTMDWNRLEPSFPNLRLLENVDCPRLISCPQGVSFPYLRLLENVECPNSLPAHEECG